MAENLASNGSGRSRRLLTFNWHETYIHMLGWLGWPMDVVPRRKGGSTRFWSEFRPLPPEARLVSLEEAHQRLEAGEYAVAICHSQADLDDLEDRPVPRVLVFHYYPAAEAKLTGLKATPEQYARAIATLARRHQVDRCVFVSEGKGEAWGIEGTVIRPGIALDEYGGYVGDEARILTVGHFLLERDVMTGYRVCRRIVVDLPHRILGLNPRLPGARPSRSWDELRHHYRHLRVFLSTLREGYEDGYNLAMLEAMATGMPVVALWNRSCPITDGVDGFHCTSPEEARQRLRELLADRERAVVLGARGREVVAKRFPKEAFVEAWRELLAEVGEDLPPPAGSGEFGDSATASDYLHRIKRQLVGHIPSWTKRLLDVSCREGRVAGRLKATRDLEVVAIAADGGRTEAIAPHVDHCFAGPLDRVELPYEEGYFDCILLANVLEKAVDPATLLARVHRLLWDRGLVLASVSNVQFIGVLAALGRGRWGARHLAELGPGPIHPFTRHDIRLVFEQSGFEVEILPLSGDPEGEKIAATGTGILHMDNVILFDLSPNDVREFFVTQYLVKARKQGAPTTVSLADRSADRAVRLPAMSFEGVIESRLEEVRTQLPPQVSAQLGLGLPRKTSPAPGEGGEDATPEVRLRRLLAAGERRAARAYLEELVRRPGDVTWDSSVAQAAFDIDQPDLALRLLEALGRSRPDAPDQLLMARCLSRLGQHDRALALIKAHIVARGEDCSAEAHVVRADVLARAQRYQEALEAYDDAIARDPDMVSAWTGKGAVYVRLDKATAAETCFVEVLKRSPEEIKAIIGMGLAAKLRQHMDRALAFFQAAFDLDPANPSALRQLIQTATQAGRLDHILPSLEEYAEKHPGALSFRLRLAQLYDERGERGRARALAENLLALDPTFEEARIFLQRTTPPAEDDRAPAAVSVSPATRPLIVVAGSIPAAVGWFLERALRRQWPLLSVGRTASLEDLAQRQMEGPDVRQHHRPRDLEIEGERLLVGDMIPHLPHDFRDATLLWVESDPPLALDDLDAFPGRTLCYLVRFQADVAGRWDDLRRFDTILVAQQAMVEQLQQRGHPDVQWLPPAYDPEFVPPPAAERDVDVAFVGRAAATSRRRELLERLDQTHQLVVDHSHLRPRGRLFARSRVALNISREGELSTRLFEAMAAGAAVVTDPLEGGGLDKLFEDRTHLAVYPQDQDVELILGELLRDEPLRAEMAEAGRRCVEDRHTYDHRARWLLDFLRGEEPGEPWRL